MHSSTVAKKFALQKFSEERNAFNMFVRPQGHTQFVLVSNSECKQKVCKKTPHGTKNCLNPQKTE